MQGMFDRALVFNSDISGWNVSSVLDMSSMFDTAQLFNSDISQWNVQSVTKMTSVFKETPRLSPCHKAAIWGSWGREQQSDAFNKHATAHLGQHLQYVCHPQRDPSPSRRTPSTLTQYVRYYGEFLLSRRRLMWGCAVGRLGGWGSGTLTVVRPTPAARRLQASLLYDMPALRCCYLTCVRHGRMRILAR